MKLLKRPLVLVAFVALINLSGASFVSANTLVAEDTNFSVKATVITAATSTASVPTEVIVQYKDGSDQVFALDEFEKPKTLQETISHFKNIPLVKNVEPNYSRNIATLPNDPFLNYQWGLHNYGQDIFGVGVVGADVDAERAWGLASTTANSEIIVAVIDTGVNYNHPDLVGQMWDGTNCVDESGAPLGGCVHGYDFAQNDKDPIPPTTVDNHGTHVAGIIAAKRNDNSGIAGLAPNVKIMAIRFNMSIATEVQAIDFARANGAKIINASFGGNGSSTAEYEAIKRFEDAGGIFIAASGNDARNNDDSNGVFHFYPSDHTLDSIISVTATNNTDDMAYFSNYGTTSVDIAAPGREILSTYENGYAWGNGTSMAAPYVAGTAAMVLGKQPSYTANQVKNALLSTGDSLPSQFGKTFSGKRVNAYEAVLSVMSSVSDTTAPNVQIISPAPTPTPPSANITAWTAPVIFWDDSAVCYYKYDFTDFIKGGFTTIPCGSDIPAPTGGYRTLTVKGKDSANNMSAEKSVTFVYNPSRPEVRGQVSISLGTVMRSQVTLDSKTYDDYTYVLQGKDWTAVSPVAKWKIEFKCLASTNEVRIQTDTTNTNICGSSVELTHTPDQYGQFYVPLYILRSDLKQSYVHVRITGYNSDGVVVGDIDQTKVLNSNEPVVPITTVYTPPEGEEPVIEPAPVEDPAAVESTPEPTEDIDVNPEEPEPTPEPEMETVEDAVE